MPRTLHWECGALAPGPPGKSPEFLLGLDHTLPMGLSLFLRALPEAELISLCPKVPSPILLFDYLVVRASLIDPWLKNPPAVQETQETQMQSLGGKDPLEKEMASTVVLLPGKSH